MHKGEQIGIDRVGVHGEHGVREAEVSLERGVGQDFSLDYRGVPVRHDLIVIAVEDEHGDRDRPQIVGLIGF